MKKYFLFFLILISFIGFLQVVYAPAPPSAPVVTNLTPDDGSSILPTTTSKNTTWTPSLTRYFFVSNPLLPYLQLAVDTKHIRDDFPPIKTRTGMGALTYSEQEYLMYTTAYYDDFIFNVKQIGNVVNQDLFSYQLSMDVAISYAVIKNPGTPPASTSATIQLTKDQYGTPMITYTGFSPLGQNTMKYYCNYNYTLNNFQLSYNGTSLISTTNANLTILSSVMKREVDSIDIGIRYPNVYEAKPIHFPDVFSLNLFKLKGPKHMRVVFYAVTNNMVSLIPPVSDQVGTVKKISEVSFSETTYLGGILKFFRFPFSSQLIVATVDATMPNALIAWVLQYNMTDVLDEGNWQVGQTAEIIYIPANTTSTDIDTYIQSQLSTQLKLLFTTSQLQ